MVSSGTLMMPARFDYRASEKFNKEFSELLNGSANGAAIKLDFIQMDYIDSAGIGLLVMSYKKAKKINAHLSIVNVKNSVKDILFLANLQKLIEIY